MAIDWAAKWDTVSKYGSNFAKFMNTNEWAANTLVGVGQGILQHEQQKEDRKTAERQNAWTNERYYAQGMGGALDPEKYGSHLTLADGRLAGQGLLTKGLQ